jgi:hypothetical protein
MIPAGLRKLLAFGSGLGIEISGPRGAETLDIAAVRVRPGGAKVLGTLRIENFPQHPAGVVGTDIASFAKKLGLGHVVATVLLPRQDVIIRTLSLPGVSDKDMSAAVGFQLDGLHPYAEEDVISSWSRLPDSSTVLVAIARRRRRALRNVLCGSRAQDRRIHLFGCGDSFRLAVVWRNAYIASAGCGRTGGRCGGIWRERLAAHVFFAGES